MAAAWPWRSGSGLWVWEPLAACGHTRSSEEQESKPARGDAPAVPALGVRDTWVCKSEASMVLRVSSGITSATPRKLCLEPHLPTPSKKKKKAALTKLCQNRQCLCFVLMKNWVGFIAVASGPALGLRVEARSFVLDTHPVLSCVCGPYFLFCNSYTELPLLALPPR